MHHPTRRSVSAHAAPWLIALLLAGCDSEAAQLVQDIDAAREGCTQDSLRAGSEECVQMFQRYAEMGTEAMQTYIGAVQAMDRALDRMPPAQFDTAGLGHAITPGILAPSGADSLAPRMSRVRAGRGFGGTTSPYGGWDADPRGSDRRRAPESYPGGRYPGEYSDDGYPGAGYDGWDPYGRYDDRYGRSGDGRGGAYYGYDRYDGYGGRDGRGSWDPGDRGYRDSRYDYDLRDDDLERGYDDPRYDRPPPRGGLLPPERRLQRPWLGERGDAHYDTSERRRALPPRRDPRADPDSSLYGERSPRSRRGFP